MTNDDDPSFVRREALVGAKSVSGLPDAPSAASVIVIVLEMSIMAKSCIIHVSNLTRYSEF